MDKNEVWNIFERTGSIKAYMMYKNMEKEPTPNENCINYEVKNEVKPNKFF